MVTEIDPGFEPGASKRVLAISIILIIFGITLIPMSLSAFRSGEPIPLLTRARPIYGWEGFVISFLAVLVGVGGIWTVTGKKKARTPGA